MVAEPPAMVRQILTMSSAIVQEVHATLGICRERPGIPAKAEPIAARCCCAGSATMRKLMIVLNAMLHEHRPCQPLDPQHSRFAAACWMASSTARFRRIIRSLLAQRTLGERWLEASPLGRRPEQSDPDLNRTAGLTPM
jgi:hypothetical protein